tara:strand:+ start:219 stop:1334 length:1116 start_codon:yes stop_codon:yes gene_type:complete
MKILITDSLLRKTFDLVNILLKNFDEEAIIFSSDHSLNKIEKIYNTKNIYLLRKNFFDIDLKIISERYKNESIIYFPIEENTTIHFYKFLIKYGDENFKYLLPSFESFNLSRNKNDLNIFCENNKIPCPKYYSKQKIYNNNFDYPLILKPKIGSGSEGIKFIKSKSELIINKIDFKNYFIQELLDNPRDIKAGFFICKEGQIISFYSHQRIRTFPEQGGVSLYSKSDLNHEIKSAGKDIIKKLNWTGFIMIEYLQDLSTNKFKLIEINPRLWGSILLSEFNNANFTSLYISLCLDQQISPNAVKSDKFIRWIFPFEIINFFKNPENPLKFFKIKEDTCYVNFTYSNPMKSFRFIFFTYFNYKKLKQKLFNG